MSISIEKERHRDCLVIRLSGELDHYTAEQVKEEITDVFETGYVKHLVLNLKGLTFMDSAGIGVVLGRYRHLSQIGGQLVICHVNQATQRLFELSGIYRIVKVTETEEEALREVGVVSHG